MEKRKLEKRNYETIEKLINITRSIDVLYKKLYELEILGKKETEEYNKNLDYLKIAIDVENKIYNDINSDSNLSILIYDYLLQDRLPDEFISDKDCIVLQDISNLVIRRIISTLKRQIMSNVDVIKDIISKELTSIIKVITNFIDNINILENEMINLSILVESLEKDLYGGFLSFLKENMTDKNNENIINELIKTKYLVLFINKNIESDMLINNFNISEYFELNSNYIAKLIKMPNNELKEYKDLYYENDITNQINKLLIISNSDYNISTKNIEAILRECFIRAIFLFLSDSNISDLNFDFHEYIESDEYKELYNNNDISESKVINCFKTINSDRKKTIKKTLNY